MLSWLFGLVVFVAGVYAIFRVWISSATTAKKILWTLIIVVFPILGVLIWALAGPRDKAY